MEQLLVKRINECLQNENFKNFPNPIIYNILEKSDKKQIQDNLLLDFIGQSIDKFFVLLRFVNVQRISIQKARHFHEYLNQLNKENAKMYMNYLYVDFDFIKKSKEIKKNRNNCIIVI